MTRFTRGLGIALLSYSLSAVLIAQAPALDIKMGAWEITATTNIGGDMPAMDTSKMTPQQKAQMEAAMKNMMGPHTMVNKSCITKEDLDKAAFLMDEQDKACKQVFTTNTRTTLETNVTCTGAAGMSGQLRVDALSQTTFKAAMKGTRREDGKATTINMTMTGKWLSADCKDIH